MQNKLYFAYGSNINLNQMEYRCPNAKVIGPVTLDNYELLFRGNVGGFGVATIKPKEGSKVHGLLWEITPQCEQSLDTYEGFPVLYGKEPVTVQSRNGQEFTVMAYVMTGRFRNAPALPSPSYYCGIREGFRQNGLSLQPLEQAVEHTREEVQAMYDHNFEVIKGKNPSQKPKKKGNNYHER